MNLVALLFPHRNILVTFRVVFSGREGGGGSVTGEIRYRSCMYKGVIGAEFLVLVVWTASFLRVVFVRCSLSSLFSSLELLLTRLLLQLRTLS